MAGNYLTKADRNQGLIMQNRMNAYPSYARLMQLLICSFFIALLTACSNKPVTQATPNPEYTRINKGKPKNIFIFFDGTANDWSSRTNVRRLFELIATREDPGQLSLYMDGVGSSSTPLTGGIFGYGMKPRILEGYQFIARHYNPDDKIFIFGFSRGSHQARSLAGLISYNGIPKFNNAGDKDSQEQAVKQLHKQIKEIWKKSIKLNDRTDIEWREWTPDSPWPYATKYQFATLPVTIKFLGIWDTVPGSSFKEYDLYKECGDGREGDRYKIQPYPPIEEIAHAVSLDEKRTKFRPVLVREPIAPEYTQLHQQWFPGAHSDVGGGYEDSNDLAGLSLNWMLGLLQKHHIFAGQQPFVYSDVAGLAHWSIGDSPGNAKSVHEDRDIPKNATFHDSINARMQLNLVPIRKNGQIVKEKYTGLNWNFEAKGCRENN